MRDYAAAYREIEVVQRQLDSRGQNPLSLTEGLRQGDVFIIGGIIQTYCFADFNARRTIDAIRHAKYGEGGRNAGTLQDKQVFPAFRKAVALLPSVNLREGLSKVADIMEMHLEQRHLFAHWAALKVINHEMLILLTKNTKEGALGSGAPLAPYQSKTVLVPLGPLKLEFEKLQGHSQYLAEQTAGIEQNFTELQQYFSELHSAEKAAKYEAGKFKKGNRGPPK